MSNLNGDSNNSIEPYVYEFLPAYYERLFPFDNLVNWMGGAQKKNQMKKSLNTNNIVKQEQNALNIDASNAGDSSETNNKNDINLGTSNSNFEESHESGNAAAIVSQLRNSFSRREITFQLPPDIYVRFNSFIDAAAWKESVKRNKPDRMEIGPVYSVEPSRKDGVHKDRFYPVLRELIFDIDMDDYDDIRTCCKGAKICRKCWGFLKAGCIYLRKILKEDLGFEHFLFVYSGRRGVHCWVSDPHIQNMGNDIRTNILAYLELFNSRNDKIGQFCKLEREKGTNSLHPLIHSAQRVLDDIFSNEILPSQEFFKGSIIDNKNLNYIHGVLKANFSGTSHEISTVKEFEKLCNPMANQNQSLEIWKFLQSISTQHPSLSTFAAETMFRLSAPRFDANVTRQMNHLTKAPFCIHPKTGRVCVPIPDIETFNFEQVPTLGRLINELNLSNGGSGSGGSGSAVTTINTGTSLQPYLEYFNRYCDELRRKREVFIRNKGKILNMDLD